MSQKGIRSTAVPKVTIGTTARDGRRGGFVTLYFAKTAL
jgi:hypothetical protein